MPAATPGVAARPPRRPAAIAARSARRGGSAGVDPAGERGRAEPQPENLGRSVGTDERELAAAAADVDDEEIALDLRTTGDAEQREQRLFLVTQDVERDAGAGVDLGDDAGRVGEPASGSVAMNVTSDAPWVRAVQA